MPTTLCPNNVSISASDSEIFRSSSTISIFTLSNGLIVYALKNIRWVKFTYQNTFFQIDGNEVCINQKTFIL